ncbi:hypothetical protein HDK77DRAFT_485256 [Phyllosticta capitalensis]|uniref:Uncharacterized protein n=1 Tax=Phyllosticta capitalensis TaxID=121624 RepID=A0ABR1YBW2_9PEZI
MPGLKVSQPVSPHTTCSANGSSSSNVTFSIDHAPCGVNDMSCSTISQEPVASPINSITCTTNSVTGSNISPNNDPSSIKIACTAVNNSCSTISSANVASPINTTCTTSEGSYSAIPSKYVPLPTTNTDCSPNDGSCSTGSSPLGNEPKVPLAAEITTQRKKQANQPWRIDIHKDARFMSSLRAIHADKGGLVVPTRRTKVDTKIIAEPQDNHSTGSQNPSKNSPPTARGRGRRKLQRSHAFIIDRSPSPSGRVCELDPDCDPNEDELCELFASTCGGFGPE